MHSALAEIDEAFGDTPRPRNDALLHERCMDDNDVVRLYPVEHWREMPDELVESEYAALSFLSPDGFRHFIPAYMGFTLRHLASGAAAVDSTIWSLAPVFYEGAGIGDFVVSRLSGLTDDQSGAVIAFLEAVRELGDDYLAGQAVRALAWWRD
ncbi:MAG TPA: DUF6714 family protein [Thermoleophilaceae bacterium]|nr:DUF6714 family protein [Thermoleophilaceae bacterium]